MKKPIPSFESLTNLFHEVYQMEAARESRPEEQ